MARLDLARRLDPSMQAALAKDAEITARHGPVAAHDVAGRRAVYDASRRYWNEGGPAPAEILDLPMGGVDGVPDLRIIYPVPERPLPALIYIHGGGWVVGSPDSHGRIMRQLAADSGWAVVGVDYRLSPEVTFPTALEDCLAAIGHIARRGAEYGLDGGRLALAGDSAGANMCLAAALHGSNGMPAPIRALLLYYGAYGLRDSASQRLYGGPEDGLSRDDLAFYFNSLMPDPAQRHDLRFDLLENDVSTLPPCFVLECALDPLADDSRALAMILADGERIHEYRRIEGVLHGFLHMSRMVPKARQALADGARFLLRHGAVDVSGP